MRRSSQLRAAALIAVALVSLLQGHASDVRRVRETALDRYVAAPDPAYRYSVVETRAGEGHTITVLELVSQSWLTAADVDRPVWTHWLTLITPAAVKHPTALVFVTGGETRGRPPQRINPALVDFAMTTNTVVAELRMVPNQPLTFAGEANPRSEDALIAYAWDKYLRTGDERWAARLPMTKAVVRAMDAISDFCGKAESRALRVDRFVVAGASKRGWATWTTAAVDPRVVAIAPMVIDLLNVETSFIHHWRVYGFWSPAVKDYEDMQIMRWMGTPHYRSLMALEDPFEYRDRLTVPKFILNSAGDQFFLPDSWRFYFDELKGEKHLRYVANTDHSLRNSDAVESLGAFYASVVAGSPRPEIRWSVERDGRIVVRTRSTPTNAMLWQATNPNTRDFRLEKIGPAYRSTAITAKEPGLFEARLEKPASGWTAGFIELRFPSGAKYPFVVTTGVAVVPDTLPFPPPKPGPAPTVSWTPE
jgi:PhoPQ-activated pathogenicity-related protein